MCKSSKLHKHLYQQKKKKKEIQQINNAINFRCVYIYITRHLLSSKKKNNNNAKATISGYSSYLNNKTVHLFEHGL